MTAKPDPKFLTWWLKTNQWKFLWEMKQMTSRLDWTWKRMRGFCEEAQLRKMRMKIKTFRIEQAKRLAIFERSWRNAMNLNKIGRNEVVREGKEINGSLNESIEYLITVRVL